MGDDEIHVRGFSKDNAIVVRRILMTGATEHGEYLGLEIETETDRRVLLIPSILFQKLMLGLLTAGGIAHRERLGRFGSDRNIVSAEGFSGFRPTGYDVARLKLVSGEDVVLVRLKQGPLAVIDITTGVAEAEKLGGDILAEATKKPAARKPAN